MCFPLLLILFLLVSASSQPLLDRTSSSLPASFLAEIELTWLLYPRISIVDINNDGCSDIFLQNSNRPGSALGWNRIWLLRNLCSKNAIGMPIFIIITIIFFNIPFLLLFSHCPLVRGGIALQLFTCF